MYKTLAILKLCVRWTYKEVEGVETSVAASQLFQV